MLLHTEIRTTAPILILGMGAGCLAQFIRHALPGARLHGVDNDDQVLAVASLAFGLNRDRKMRLYLKDASNAVDEFVSKTNHRFDTVFIDVNAPDGELGLAAPSIRMLSTAALTKLKQCLTSRGLVVLNLLPAEGAVGSEVIQASCVRFQEHFKSVVALTSTAAGSNIIIVASVGIMQLPNWLIPVRDSTFILRVPNEIPTLDTLCDGAKLLVAALHHTWDSTTMADET